MRHPLLLVVCAWFALHGCDCGDGLPAVDAGEDAGLVDDAGLVVDAGHDAGLPDAGHDAGLADAGHDAGLPDSGTDAGLPDAGLDAGWVQVQNVGAQTIVVGATFSLQVVATANDPITYSVQAGALPDGLTLDAATGLISGAPSPASLVGGAPAGTHAGLVIRAATPRASADTAPFTIDVTGVPLPKPLVYWNFDDASLTDGGLVLQDGTANDHDGVLSGGVTTGVAGPLGQSFSWDGTNDLVRGPGLPAPADDYTLVVVVKPALPDGQPHIPIAYGMSAPTPTYRGTWLQVQAAGTVVAVFEDGADVLATGSSVVDAGVWTPVGLTWQAATREGRLYVGGRLEATATASGPVLFATTTLECGRHSQFMSRWWNGGLDEAAMFHARLDDAQMATLAWHFLRGRDLATVTGLP